MVGVQQPLGPFFGASGQLIPGGALLFCEIGTTTPKTVYADEALTVEAQNPAILRSDSCTQYQYFLGTGQYSIYLYSLLDNTVSPVFPTDYAFVRQWDQDGVIVATVPTGTMFTVDTVADLIATDPAIAGTVVTVLGYYSKLDNIPPRTYYWSPSSIETANGGTVLEADGYAVGRWLLKAPSPVVDVRWFGALPGVAIDCNSALVSASSYALSGASRTLYFPSGTYQVTPGNITSTAPLKMSYGVQFYNRLAGDFEVRVNGRFVIDVTGQFEHASSVGTVTPVFTSNQMGASNGDTVNESWWTNGLTGAIKNCGTCPILVLRAQTVSDIGGDYTVSKLVVRGSGAAAFSDGGHTVTIASLDAPQGTQVITGSSAISPCVAFGGTVYSSTVSADIVRWASGPSAVLVMDADRGMGAFNSSPDWGMIIGAGGAIVTSAGKTTTISGNVSGQVHSCAGTVLGSANLENFFTNTDSELIGYIRSAVAVNGQADFGGRIVSNNVDLSEFDSVLLEDASFSGSISFRPSGTNQTVVMKRCGITGATSGTYVGLTLTDCTWAQVGATESFLGGINARDCVLNFAGDIAGSGLTLTDCNVVLTDGKHLNFDTVRIDGGSISSATGGYCSIDCSGNYWGTDSLYENVSINPAPNWDIQFHGNKCKNSFVTFVGTGTILNIDIKNNLFVNSASLTLYEPLNIDSMTVTGVTHCYVGYNEPSTAVASNRASGVAIRQTAFKIRQQVGAGALRFQSLETADQNYAFAPYLNDGDLFRFGINTNSISTNVVPGMVTDTGRVGYQVLVPNLETSYTELQIY